MSTLSGHISKIINYFLSGIFKGQKRLAPSFLGITCIFVPITSALRLTACNIPCLRLTLMLPFRVQG